MSIVIVDELGENDIAYLVFAKTPNGRVFLGGIMAESPDQAVVKYKDLMLEAESVHRGGFIDEKMMRSFDYPWFAEVAPHGMPQSMKEVRMMYGHL